MSDAVRSFVDLPFDELDRVLSSTTVTVRFGDDTTAEFEAGALLLVNLLARLYPKLRWVGPDALMSMGAELALSVNPDVEVAGELGRQVVVGFGVDGDDVDVAVFASGWAVLVDPTTPVDADLPAAVFAHLAAACFAAAELFRIVFAALLGHNARSGRQPGVFDLVTCSSVRCGALTDLRAVVLPPLHLAGAGAIGQAAVLALSSTGASGSVTIVDAETISLSNLQRYVLATLDDVGTVKVDLACAVLRSSGWLADPVPTIWGADVRSAPRQELVLVALDSARDRLGVAGGLHRRVYNAWTQPSDLGWSRHESFGSEPCLACLYYPDRVRPSDDEQVAAALRQPRLRVLSYFASNQPVGLPLRAVSPVADLPAPPEAQDWLTVPLLADLVASGMVAVEQAPEWANKTIGELYVEGVCGGALVRLAGGDLAEEAAVPLAHQSALAGVLLALQPFAAEVPELRQCRQEAVESRLDLLVGLPQVAGRPRVRTPSCICSDPVFASVAPAEASGSEPDPSG